MNAKLKAVFSSCIDKSLLKCLLVNDNVNNVKLSYDVIFYVTLFVAAIFISPVFRTHWRYWLKRQKSLRGCNKKVMIWPRCASRSYWHWGSHIGPSGLQILLHGVISLPDATSYD